MSLELAGVRRIDTSSEARAHARRWDRMAREIDTPGAPLEAKEKAAELRRRAKAANDWARREEDALVHAQQAHDREEGSSEPEAVTRKRARGGGVRAGASRGARVAGNKAYHAAKPRALRIAARGRQHFFQGAGQPFAVAGGGWDLFWEGLGASLAVVLLYDLLSAPGALVETGSHTLGFLNRAVALRDPISGLGPVTAARPRSTAPARPATSTTTTRGTQA